MKKCFITFFLIVFSIYFNKIQAQEKTIYGHIIDSESLEPLAGVSITTQPQGIVTISDTDGTFILRISNKVSQITLSLIGYEQFSIDISGKVDLGTIKMNPNGLLLKDVLVTAQLALPRKTPIAVSSVAGNYIDENLGNKEFVEILKHTPGVHANRQGGGWADSEIYIRGFDNSNIAVMINGIPVNDPENGIVYWSNWASLSDVASIVQSQRGIGSGKVASPSVGGTINIITKGIETKKGGSISYGVGNEGFQKFNFSLSSGLMNNGWSLTLQGGGSSGNGYFQGGDFKVKDFFVNVSKRLGKSHQVSLTSFGSFQEHYSRSDALTKSEWNKVKSLYSIDGHWTRYNPELGYNSEGQRRSSQFEHFNNAMIFVNHIWQIDPKSSLSTNLYYSLGKGFSHSGLADEDEFSEYDWYAADYGILNTMFRTKNGTFDYSKIEAINTSSTKGSLLVMSKTIGNYGTLGLVSTYKNSLSKYINLTTGIDIRSYKGLHKNTLQDLLGGEYYIDPGRKDVDIEKNAIATDSWKNAHLGIGDILYRDYDSHIVQEGCFAEVEYANNSFNTFISSAISYSQIWRFDRFYYSRDNSKSHIANYWGGNIKTGANYNISQNHNIYANLGYVSRAPKFKGGVFMSATSSHTINKRAANEKALSVELGYGFHNKYLDLDINSYLIEWLDKAMAKKGKLGGQYYLNMTGVNSLHIGIESAFKVKPTRWIDISGMLSIGEWKWNSNNVKGYAYNLSGQAITTEGKVTTPGSADHAWALINMKGIHVGGSAQTTANIDITFKPYNGLKLGCAYTFFDRNYAYYSLSGSNLSIGKELFVSQPWKVPSGGSWDAHISYSFKIANMNASLLAQMNNIANSHYIEKAWNPSNVSSKKQTVNPDDVYMFYSLGRMWSIKLKISF